jgi:hypothetical protein
MSTAQGVIIRNSANRLTAVFVIDGLQITFSATVSPSIQPFTTDNVTLTYGNVEELVATRSYSGQVGPEKIRLALDNGPKIEGTLSLPGVSPASVVNGTGTWEQN